MQYLKGLFLTVQTFKGLDMSVFHSAQWGRGAIARDPMKRDGGRLQKNSEKVKFATFLAPEVPL